MTSPPVDAVIARHADRQHALVTIEQLRAAGLSDSAVGKRVARRVLFRKSRGVYSRAMQNSRVKASSSPRCSPAERARCSVMQPPQNCSV